MWAAAAAAADTAAAGACAAAAAAAVPTGVTQVPARATQPAVCAFVFAADPLSTDPARFQDFEACVGYFKNALVEPIYFKHVGEAWDCPRNYIQ